MKRDLGIYAVAVATVAVVALAWPWPAQAHNASIFRSPHEWLEDLFGKKTEAPPVRPLEPCTPDREGEYVVIFDPILKVWVQWSCQCPGDGHGCRWFRVAWYPERPYVPGSVVTRQWGVDTHRSCRAIVCKRHRHKHWWFAMHRAESPVFRGRVVEWTP